VRVDVTITDGVVPKHEQLRHLLVELCTTQLSPGDVLPSERQLCLDHGVSRITVREAVGQLVQEGLLVRVRGKGTFVAQRTVRSQLHLASFHEDMRRMGLKPTTVVLSVDTALPPPGTATALRLTAEQLACHVRRLRIANGSPISLDDAWYSLTLLPGLDQVDLTGSLYDTLAQRYGRPVDRAEQTVSAEEASAEVAAVLGIRAGGSVLAFDRVSHSRGEPVEHARSWYRADRYQLQMTLGAEG